MGTLTGQTAVVTGGSAGIGLATAKRLAAEGASVIITGRRKGALDAAIDAIGPGTVGVQSDAAELDQIHELFAQLVRDGSTVDILFVNAGGGEFAPIGAITPDHYTATFDRNVRGAIFTVQEALPALNDGARIVLLGSSAASAGTPAFGVYAASKAAVRSFGRTWAAELADRRIRVNTLIPGPTSTPGLAGLAPDAEHAQGLLDTIASTVPLGRLADTDEIAAGAYFLASDESSFMTGGELVVDGGQGQL